MKEDLKKHMLQFCRFNDDQLFDILSRFEYETLKKGDLFYEGDRICRKIGFIRSGSVRSYYNIDGNEITRFVLIENHFFTAFQSFYTKKPSPEYIQAVEKTELYTINQSSIQELFNKYPEMVQLNQLVTIESHLRLEKRVFNLIAKTAEERYREFENDNPEMIQRVPLQYIASILGMKPETLSRIRKKLKDG